MVDPRIDKVNPFVYGGSGSVEGVPPPQRIAGVGVGRAPQIRDIPHPFLRLTHHLGNKKLFRRFRAYLMHHSVHRNRYAGMLALLLAEAGFKGYLIVQGFFLDKLLESLNDIVGAFNVTGTADTYT
jgi:hypothetical protein